MRQGQQHDVRGYVETWVHATGVGLGSYYPPTEAEAKAAAAGGVLPVGSGDRRPGSGGDGTGSSGQGDEDQEKHLQQASLRRYFSGVTNNLVALVEQRLNQAKPVSGTVVSVSYCEH